MSYHRLLEARSVGGRMRESGALIDYRGPRSPYFEPLDAGEHKIWLRAMRQRDAAPATRAAA